jgi:NADPH:quinone reductase-like Zn-dependent oxidoreductase
VAGADESDRPGSVWRAAVVPVPRPERGKVLVRVRARAVHVLRDSRVVDMLGGGPLPRIC